MSVCRTCGANEYGMAQDCENTGDRMLVDTCYTVRGNGGYCAAHPTSIAMDFGPVYRTRAEAARSYAAAEWQCNPCDLIARNSRGQYLCRYIVRKK